MKVIGLFGMLLHVLNGLGYRQTMHDRSIPFQFITPLHFYVLHVGFVRGDQEAKLPVTQPADSFYIIYQQLSW